MTTFDNPFFFNDESSAKESIDEIIVGLMPLDTELVSIKFFKCNLDGDNSREG